MSSKHTGKNDVTQKLFVEAGTGIGHEKDGQRRCLGCMELYSEEYEVCPYCGYTIEEEVENALHMFPGTVLYDKYIIGRVIGYGGFGVTYLAWDTVLQIKVAIKEYLPSEFSTRAAGQTQITVFSGDKTKQFNDGMEKFIDEAKRLAKFRSENGIVKIFDSFGENGTAYIAMEYLQGETLAERLEREKTIPIEESIQMLMPIIESLNKVHDEGIIHRDIAPDNIFLTNKGEVKLIDFGASRYATTSRSRSLTVIIKPGFSAEEQYRSRGDQGPHTDVYSVGACLYKMITGQAPPDAMERRALFEKNGRDMLVPIKKFIKDIDPRRENAIYNALNIRIEDRTPDMISLAGELLSEEPVKKRRSGIKKIDPLTWPLWAKIGIPTGLVAAITLCVLFAFGIIGPKSDLETRFVVPEGQTLIPNVVAGTLEDAKSKLKAENLNWQIAGKVISTVIDRDLVLRQEPDAFNVVDHGTVIDIIISDGHGMGTVPDVIGLTIELATEKLKEAGYTVKTVEESSDIYASGAVIAQEYEAGTMLEKDNEIQLTVSTGPEGIDRTKVVTVPSILGMDYEAAKKLLADFNLFPAIDEEVFNSSIPDNQIMGQNPLANTQAHQGDTIYVTVNRGTQTVYVPDVVNKTLEMALSELEEAGLNVSTKEAQNAEYAPGVVFQQSIKPGTSVTIGTSITVTVSSGVKVKVPDLTGQRASTAQQTLANAGLASSITTEPSDSVARDRVITHDYIGEEVERGTSITLVVSSGRDRTNSGGNGGNNDDSGNEASVASLVSLKVKNRPNKTEYYVGDSLDTSGLKVVAVYSDDSEKDVTSNCHVLDADLSNAGSISVKVTFEDNGIEKTASFSVEVNKPSVKLESSFNLAVNQEITLTAKVKPETVNVSWSIDDDKIAEISGDKLKGVKAGRTRVTATISYGNEEYTASATVNVSSGKIPVEKVVLDRTSLTLRVGGKQTLKVTPIPANATDPKYTWKSSNTSVAGVSNNGEVLGVGDGKATITVTEAGGAKSNPPCTVTVEPATLERIEIVTKPKNLEYYPTDTVSLAGIKIAAYYNVGSPIYITDTSLLTFKHASFTKKGDYEVTVTYKGKSASYKVEVRDATMTLTCPVGSLTTKGSTTAQLEVNVKPESLQGKVKFTSENDCAKVDSKGVVTALKAGTAKITATVTHGDVTLKRTISIKIMDLEITSINIKKEPTKKEYYIGDTIDTSGMKIELVYSDKSKETIDPNGSTKVRFKNSNSEVLKSNDISGSKATVVVSYSGVSGTKSFTVTAKTPSIKIDTASCTLDAGGKAKQVNVSNYVCGDHYEITWESSNAKVASVSKDSSNEMKAEIKGVGEGEAQIKAVLTYKGSKYYSEACKVTVKGATITSIEIKDEPKNTSNYYIGDNLDTSGMSIIVKYSTGKSETVSKGYTVNVDKLTSKGSQTVTVSYGGKTDTFTVSVKEPQISFSFPAETLSTSKAETLAADVKCTPSEGWDLKFTSSDTSIATVGENGVVTGQGAGTVTITLVAKYKDTYSSRDLKQQIKIEDVQPLSFEISSPPKKMTYYIGESFAVDGLMVKVYYSNGTTDSRDSSGLITASLTKNKEKPELKIDPSMVSRGIATVYVYYGDFTEPETIQITVKTPKITISPTSLSLEEGEKGELEVSSVDVSSDNKSYSVSSWEVKDTGIATVSANGDKKEATINAKSAGTTQVRAVMKYLDYTYYSDWCTVTVKEKETTTKEPAPSEDAQAVDTQDE
ncbi:MAG: PASTA domain-containing protein [Clostridia bacterium]|nr:PASTA domain-containing protein [Clostridia bacterium]